MQSLVIVFKVCTHSSLEKIIFTSLLCCHPFWLRITQSTSPVSCESRTNKVLTAHQQSIDLVRVDNLVPTLPVGWPGSFTHLVCSLCWIPHSLSQVSFWAKNMWFTPIAVSGKAASGHPCYTVPNYEEALLFNFCVKSWRIFHYRLTSSSLKRVDPWQ